MNNKYIFGLVSGVVISGVVAVNANTHNNTIQSCATLLPSGHSFELTISGQIDTNTAEREFKGSLGLSDGNSQNNPPLQSASQPFINCVTSILK